MQIHHKDPERVAKVHGEVDGFVLYSRNDIPMTKYKVADTSVSRVSLFRLPADVFWGRYSG